MGHLDWAVNTGTLRASVTLGDGRAADLEIEPGRASIDREGYVRVFSVTLSDGTAMTYKLLPRHRNALAALETIAQFFAVFGLARVGRRYVKGNAFVRDVGVFTANSFGAGPVVHHLFDKISMHDSPAYYDIETGDLVIQHAIRVKNF